MTSIQALPKGPTTVGLNALREFDRRVGIREKPPGSNRGPEIDLWNIRAGVPVGSPYCDTCLHDVFATVGYDLGANFANADSYCPDLYKWGWWHGMVRIRPYMSYIVLFDWDQDGVLDHVGLVKKVRALRWSTSKRFVGLIDTYEANTSSGLKGSQSDGDGVYQRTRWVNESTKFLRVDGSVK